MVEEANLINNFQTKQKKNISTVSRERETKKFWRKFRGKKKASKTEKGATHSSGFTS